VAPRTKQRSKSKVSRMSDRDRISHLHVVIDDELREHLEGHASTLGGAARHKKPNVSKAVRDILREKFGLARTADDLTAA